MDPAVEELPPPASAAPRTSQLELTPRALIVGAAIGVILSVGNGYMGLKTSFIDGGSIMAALLGFAFFATFGKSSRTPYSGLENNITQTVASSAAIMGYTIGLSGAIPALNLLGSHYSGGALALWGITVGMVGILVGMFLRRKLVLAERLPFPTGAATAEVIETISASRATAMLRARALVASALVAAAVAWFRDGRPSLIPQATSFGGAVLGVSLASLTVGVSFSPLMFSTGMLIGVRNATSMLAGGVLTWLVGAPLLVRYGIVPTASFSACSGWLVWPGVGLLLASSFVPLLMDWRALVRSFRDIPSLLLRRRAAEAIDLDADHSRFPLAKPIFIGSVVVLIVMGRVVFALPPVMIVVGLIIALVLANVCARSAGETDLAPMGAIGTMTQLMFTGSGPVPSLITGSISAGISTQTSQTLWAFKAGHRLRASARAQTWAQILGAVVGALVAVPVYFVMTRAYGIGTEAMPAPAALGLGVMTPFSYSLTAAIGGFVLFSVKRIRPAASDATLMATAAGGIAGESVMGVVVAALIATGLL